MRFTAGWAGLNDLEHEEKRQSGFARLALSRVLMVQTTTSQMSCNSPHPHKSVTINHITSRALLASL